jgi:hypothetical protein
MSDQSIMSAFPLTLLAPLFLVTTVWIVWSGYYLLHYYRLAATVGVPLRVLPISHGNPFWMLLGRKLIQATWSLLPWKNEINFFRYNWRGWEIRDRYKSHLEMGDVWMHVTPGENTLYICNPDSVVEIFKRKSDFPRPLQLLSE